MSNNDWLTTPQHPSEDFNGNPALPMQFLLEKTDSEFEYHIIAGVPIESVSSKNKLVYRKLPSGHNSFCRSIETVASDGETYIGVFVTDGEESWFIKCVLLAHNVKQAYFECRNYNDDHFLATLFNPEFKDYPILYLLDACKEDFESRRIYKVNPDTNEPIGKGLPVPSEVEVTLEYILSAFKHPKHSS